MSGRVRGSMSCGSVDIPISVRKTHKWEKNGRRKRKLLPENEEIFGGNTHKLIDKKCIKKKERVRHLPGYCL